jgi:hypothetical protein
MDIIIQLKSKIIILSFIIDHLTILLKVLLSKTIYSLLRELNINQDFLTVKTVTIFSLHGYPYLNALYTDS